MKCVCKTITASKQQQVLNIKSVCLYFCLSYPAHKGHLLCCTAVCGLSGSSIFLP